MSIPLIIILVIVVVLVVAVIGLYNNLVKGMGGTISGGNPASLIPTAFD